MAVHCACFVRPALALQVEPKAHTQSGEVSTVCGMGGEGATTDSVGQWGWGEKQAVMGRAGRVRGPGAVDADLGTW